MKTRLFLLFLCVAVSAITLNGQPLTIGPNPATSNASAGGAGVATFVDLSAPATLSGTVNTASFIWAASPCAATAKIKFFHRSGSTLTFFDERGPFNTTTSSIITTVPLTPPVPVQPGDVIGIVQLTTCGNATALAGTAASPGYVVFNGDVTSTVNTGAGTVIFNSFLAVGGNGIGSGSGTNVPALSRAMLALLAFIVAITGMVLLRK